MPHPTRRFGAVPVLAIALPVLVGCLGTRAPVSQLSPAERAEASRLQDSRGGTDAASTLSDRELNPSAVTRFDQLLVGRVAGVRVTSRGNEFSVRIRNAGGLYTSGEPLYLLDGLPVPGYVLASLHPQHVERIQVIKDGMAAAYGVQGANGVIVVTTIRPR